MTKRKPTKHEDDVRRGLRTNQYNGIIDTQLKTIDDLKAEVERLRNLATKIDAYVDVLVLENGRLRKAGDVMAEGMLKYIEPTDGYLTYLECRANWNAAKEGKPSV